MPKFFVRIAHGEEGVIESWFLMKVLWEIFRKRSTLILGQVTKSNFIMILPCSFLRSGLK